MESRWTTAPNGTDAEVTLICPRRLPRVSLEPMFAGFEEWTGNELVTRHLIVRSPRPELGRGATQRPVVGASPHLVSPGGVPDRQERGTTPRTERRAAPQPTNGPIASMASGVRM
jgi:hypothetical protein